MRAFVVALVPLVGCGYGLNQTAKTQRPGTVSLGTGLSYIWNENVSAQVGGGPFLGLGHDVGPLRMGLSDHVDMGLGLFYAGGLRLDGKFNVLERSNRLAIAPRIGAGFASFGRQTAMWMAGIIVSEDVMPELAPYAAATFANHWIAGEKPQQISLNPGEHLAHPTGAGNGLLQLVGGLQWRPNSVVALYMEYGFWLPMQQDPGSFYTFITSQVASVGVRICFRGRCD